LKILKKFGDAERGSGAGKRPIRDNKNKKKDSSE